MLLHCLLAQPAVNCPRMHVSSIQCSALTEQC